MEVKRGEIYFANLGDASCNLNSEQEGFRPVLILQNDIGNKYSHLLLSEKTPLFRSALIIIKHLETKLLTFQPILNL